MLCSKIRSTDLLLCVRNRIKIRHIIPIEFVLVLAVLYEKKTAKDNLRHEISVRADSGIERDMIFGVFLRI